MVMTKNGHLPSVDVNTQVTRPVQKFPSFTWRTTLFFYNNESILTVFNDNTRHLTYKIYTGKKMRNRKPKVKPIDEINISRSA